MTKTLYNTFLSILFIGIISCETREANPINIKGELEYYPLQKGVYSIYAIKEKTYSIISGNDSSEYFIKESVVDSVIDSYNHLTYHINRYRKAKENDVWKIDSVWSARYEGNLIIKIENNVPFVKLSTPVKVGKEWNGNAFNTRGEENYKIEFVNKPLTLDTLEFDTTVTLIQKDDSSSIAQDFRLETYAKGVGLVYKKTIVTTNLQKDGTIVFPIEINKGIDMTQTIIEYGKE